MGESLDSVNDAFADIVFLPTFSLLKALVRHRELDVFAMAKVSIGWVDDFEDQWRVSFGDLGNAKTMHRPPETSARALTCKVGS